MTRPTPSRYRSINGMDYNHTLDFRDGDKLRVGQSIPPPIVDDKGKQLKAGGMRVVASAKGSEFTTFFVFSR